MSKYIVKENPPYKIYKSTGGQEVKVPRNTQYSVYYDNIIVLDIKDHFRNSKGVGEGICALLNEGKIVLDLEI